VSYFTLAAKVTTISDRFSCHRLTGGLGGGLGGGGLGGGGLGGGGLGGGGLGGGLGGCKMKWKIERLPVCVTD
jgi:hypothetical protein